MSLTFPPNPKQVCIIAEISANHNQDRARAFALLNAAINAGADAIKIQTYTADTLTLKSNRPEFKIDQESLWQGRTLHDLYQEACTPWEWQKEMKEYSEDRGIPLFSSPFDSSSVKFLESINVPAYKIASPEIVDKELIQMCAATGKPIVISTGMSRMEEIGEAVTWARQGGADDITLLKCTSAYPAKSSEMNLNSIPQLASKFGLPVGLSDHTLGDTVAIAAVALGARMIEKHFTLYRSDGGPDAAFSMEPEEFRKMVNQIRMTEEALGSREWTMSPREKENRIFRRSLYWIEDLTEGQLVERKHFKSIRPANGLPPKHLNTLLGSKVTRSVKNGDPIKPSDFTKVGNL
ncbi:MAG: pseudaminic acid synthase [Verrucomicrobiota bacterium]